MNEWQRNGEEQFSPQKDVSAKTRPLSFLMVCSKADSVHRPFSSLASCLPLNKISSTVGIAGIFMDEGDVMED